MAIYQKNISISEKKNVNSMTAFAALFVAMFIVMASFGVMAAGSMNEAAPAAIINPPTTTSIPPVDLGSAGNYTIFALTGIDTTPGASTITGDIGTGPGVTSTAITGFTLSHTVATAYATSTQVSGKVYAFDYSDPTPTNVTTAKADVEGAYTDAAGQPAGVGPFLNVGGGTVSDQTLVPGVYTWTTAVNIPTDLTFSGTSTDVWVLQISGTLTMASAKSVLMIGGAQPQNIFWQVSGAVTIGAGTHVEGIILGATSITFGAGASINGRLLAQTAVNLNACVVTEPNEASSAPISAADPITPYWNNTGQLNITASGTDCDSILLYYNYSADNATWEDGSVFGNDTAFPWYWDFTFSNGTGYYEFFTRAWNGTDSVREDAPGGADARCAYETLAPASACNVAGAYWRNTGPVVINATASDATSGLANVSLYYRYGAVNGTFGAWTLSSTDIMAPWSFSFAFASGQGYYQFYTIAADNATNVELAPGTADAEFAYDSVNPASNVNAITPYVSVASPKTITAVASDALSGPASVALWYAYSAANVTFGAYVNFGADVVLPWSWDFSFPAGSGYYNFYTIATDNATNIEIAPVAADTSTMFDSAGPTILTTTPIDDSISISTNAGTYIIHFSEPMKTTVGTALTTLPGTSWVWSADKMWYNSTYTTLQISTKYYVNLTGFTDLADNALSGDISKAFTTASIMGSIRLPVDLGTADDFVVLAKTAITTTGTTLITGDVGISPAAASYITGFGLILDSTTTFSTSSLVVGKVYAADYTPPTPTKMTTAISDMETAYTDAAGRTIPDYVELGAGDITGMTLSPGLYKWDTGLLISAGGVTLSGNSTAVWIFQIGIDFTVANGAIITLAGGARPYNIFWQVAGEVTIGTTVAMKGVILCQTQIVIKTGASFVGRALAQTQVTIDGNIITDPKDTIAPMVSSTIPANGATGVAINSAMTATFNEVMDPLTLNATTFTLKHGATPVSGTITYSLVTAVFTPLANLASSTVYTATITTGAKDLGGNALASNYVWNFTTGAVADIIPPTVSSTVPLHAATGVAINSAMTATFSEAMDVLTITNATFLLKRGTTPVSGAVTYVGFTGTFRPSADLLPSTVYTATITTGAKDLAGNPLASNYSWTFITGTAPDIDPPTVSSTVPANGAIDVVISTAITATFSEAMNPLTITTTTFTLKHGVTPVSGVVTYTGVTAIFTATFGLSFTTEYTATITTGAKDLAGNVLSKNYTWMFTTGDLVFITPPTVTWTIPMHGSRLVAINSAMSATFSEAMDPLTITPVSFTLVRGITPVLGVVTYVGFTATFRPSVNLTYSTDYTATITNDAMDLEGTPMIADYVWTFTTGVAPDTIAPMVTSTVPANGATDVATNNAITATFSEAMDPLTITTTTFILKQGTTVVRGTVTYVGLTATFTDNIAPIEPVPDPSRSSTVPVLGPDFAYNTIYTATITTEVKDLAGNAMVSDYTWSWTTGLTSDTTAPTVTSTINANGATDVPINTMVGATFSEAMDPLTITTITFTLKQGTTAVSGIVTYSLVSAVFNPDSNLAANTVYTATITTGAKDLAGNALAADYIWSWTTGLTPDTTAPMVTSTIHVNGATDVPINTMVGATFSEAMDPLTITTITFTLKQGTTAVSGIVTYSLVSAVFNPDSNLAASTVYTATITTGAKDLAGNAMAADYIWSWTTGLTPDTTAPMVTSTIPLQAATGVAINSAMSATFSEAMDPLTITTITFTLKQGTTPVSGAVTYSLVTAVFTPLANLASSTVYTATITTGAKDLAGNALASNYLWSFTTGAAADTTSPTITSTINADGATDVPINTKVGATFSEAMNPLTITTITFTLKQGTTPVSGTVTYSLVTAIFTPLADLAFNTVYTATITTGVKDLAGNAMASNYVWSWTTGDTPDTTAPTVVSTIPTNAGTDVAINSAMSVTFSEGMDPLTITTITFTLKQGTTPVSGAVTYSLVTAVFTPLANLASSTAYTATITTGAQDLAGNALASNYVWSFTTGAVADTTAPTVISTVNADGATNVATNTRIGATFSEAMDPLTITTSTFILEQGTNQISGTVTYSGVIAVFAPASILAANTEYTCTITKGAKDLAGNAMASDYVWSWTTGDAPDTTAPTVISTIPANAGTGVAINSAMSATFSEAMDPLTITTITFTLKQGTTPVPGTVTYAGNTATFTPAGNLIVNTTYTATITTGTKDLANNALAANYVWTFDTIPAIIPPAYGTIIGTIVDENGDPIEGAVVSLGDTGLIATTNAAGEYTFTNVVPGTYVLGINATGYEPTSVTATVTAGETTTVPDTALVPSDDDTGGSNWWWILLVAAAVLVAAIIGWTLMSKKKPDADAKTDSDTGEETDAGNEADTGSETPPEEGQADAGAEGKEPAGQEGQT